MVHPLGTPRAGEIYRIVIYQARLCGLPEDLQQDELKGVIALTTGQVRQGIQRKPTLAQLIEEGALILAGCVTVDPQVRLLPLGTAVALAYVLQLKAEEKKEST
jgi:hypothetical protein